MRLTRLLTPLVLAALLSNCGGNDGGPSTQVLKIEKWPPSGDNQTDTVGHTLVKPIRVKVTLNGQVVAGYMVHFDGGDLGTDSMLTGADGIATSTWTLGGAIGTQFVTASLDSAQGSPLTFHATAVTGAPASIEAVSGDSQIVVVNALFGAPLVVKIADQFGNGVTGQWIHFSAGAHILLGADSIITNDQGLVSLNMTAAATPGADTVIATSGTVAGSPLKIGQWIASTIDTVTITDAGFSPDTAVISAGDAIVWRWVSGSHSVTPDSIGAFPGTDTFEAPHSFGPILFPSSGTFGYHDTVHPGVSGAIKVN